MAPSPDSPTPSASSVFRSRDFRLYVAGRFLATLAIQMQSVAVGWQIYDLTNDALALGYVGLALFAPIAVLTLPAGDVADRFDRRRVLGASALVQALSAVALLAITHAGGGAVAPFYAALALFGAARAFAGPAQQSLLPLIVPTENFATAVAWGATAFKIAIIVGPALGGVLYLLGPEAVYAVCVALQLALAATVIAIRARAARGERTEADSGAIARLLVGIAYVRRSPIILGAISLDLFAVLFGGVVALLPVFARDVLGTGPEGLGLLRSAPAIGGIGLALMLARRPLPGRAGLAMFGGVALFGVCSIVFGLSRDFALSFAALALMGAGDMVSVYVRSTAIQLATPDSMRGRVSAVNLLFIGGSNELGDFRAGATAAWLGVVPAVFVGGLGTLAVVAIGAWLFPALRRLDRLGDLAPTARSGP